jgi:hypothetical protein
MVEWCACAHLGLLGALIGLVRQGRHRPMIAPTYCRFKRRVDHDGRDYFLTDTRVLFSAAGQKWLKPTGKVSNPPCSRG